MKTPSISLSSNLSAIMVAAFLAVTISARAATFTWDGGAASTDIALTAAANWAGDVAPADLGNEFIIGAVPSDKDPFIYMNLGGNGRSITFDSSLNKALTILPSATSWGNGNMLIFHTDAVANPVVNNSFHTQTFNTPIRQYWQAGSSTRTWSAANGSLVFANTVFLNGDGIAGQGKIWELRADGTNSITLASVALTGFSDNTYAPVLNKVGTGSLVIQNPFDSNYSSAVNVNEGTLVLSGAGSLSSASPVSVASGATFDVGGRDQTVSGLTGAGSVTNASGNLTVNLNTISNTFSGVISGAGALVKTGGQELTLSGNNTYSGGTALQTGSLKVSSTTALGTGVLTASTGASILANQTGTVSNAISLASGVGDHVLLRTSASAGFSGNITSHGGSKFLVYGQGAATGTVTFSNNTLSLGSEEFSVWAVGANSKVQSDNNLWVFDNVNFSTSSNFTVTGAKVQVDGNSTMNIGGHLQSTANWSQFAMNGGSVTVTNGVDYAAGVVAAGLTFNGGTLTTPHIYGAEWYGEAITLFNGTTVVASESTSDFLRVKLNGGDTHGATAKIGAGGAKFDTAGYNITISNSLADNSGDHGFLTKQGNGTLILSANNTFTGDTTVTAGTLIINGSTSTGAVDVDSLATLGGNGTIGGATTVAGNLNPGNSPGDLSFGDILTLESSATLTLEITGIGAGQFDRLLGDGTNTLTFGGILALNNTGYSAVLGNSITVFSNWSTFSGSFSTFTGTDLGGGLFWDTNNLGIDGSITVIPEPSTRVLLVGCLLALIVFRRRRVA